jgi:hypothetical protein
VDLHALDVLSADQVLRLAGGLEAAGTVTHLSTHNYEPSYEPSTIKHPAQVGIRLALLIANLPTLRRLGLEDLYTLAHGLPPVR